MIEARRVVLSSRMRNRGLAVIGPFQTRPATGFWRLAFSTLTLFSEKGSPYCT